MELPLASSLKFPPPGSIPPPTSDLHTTVLLVGSVSTGKRTLARSILRTIKDRRFEFRTTGALPLPHNITARVDYVVLLVNQTDYSSLEAFRVSMLHLPAEYFLGRCAVVLTHVDQAQRWAFELNVLYNSVVDICPTLPTFLVNLTSPQEAHVVAQHLATAFDTACGRTHDMTPLASQIISLDCTDSIEECWQESLSDLSGHLEDDVDMRAVDGHS
ncbi:centromere protein M (CENP-M)-domain-containing protein [Thamnocephalis sphaerospora]|uniref:Centromere protein M n=1 Tax=Thamnocephalis sphaerospora TaxID=78915 RepID=A0A4P9XQN1_9FUNG|nr:centromere protein M (CENP-M)-domain-containing protein [Thamnocephalis sphaerospora]|eukprot:RKP07600.1 centromere protein M (CENP-M)-domain-containing protein [Thamnocephalis sphaerospora]